MYQGEEVQEDGEDTDKGYNSYSIVVGKKEKGYLEGSNMDMGNMGMDRCIWRLGVLIGWGWITIQYLITILP